MLRVGNENTCVTVNWISAALKVTAGYIPAVTVDFCSFDKKQRKFHSYMEDYAILFYVRLFNFSSRLLIE